MKLTSIRLCNFRSFYGKTPEIILATGDKLNTTIIHGNNGAGKTSLLNAFTWVLYEKFSAAFATAEQLVNKRAIAESKPNQSIECWVEINWEHEGKRYRVKRQCRAYKKEAECEITKTEILMQISDRDGRWYFPHQQPEDIIGQILPVSLHQYFFFDGERIEEIVRSDKKTEIAEATKIFLGVEVINRSIRHLAEAKKTLEQELKAIGNSEVKKLLKELSQVELEIEEINHRQQEINQELDYRTTLKKETNNRLQELSSARDLQQRRQNLEKQKKHYQNQLLQTREIIKKTISAKGYAVLLADSTARFRDILHHLKQNGKFTTGISQEFLNELLQSHRCICGIDLHEDNQAHANIKKLLNETSSASIEETAIRMSAQVDEIDNQSNLFWEEIDREQIRVNRLRQNIAEVENELDSIQEKLLKDPSEEIRNLQKSLDAVEREITHLTLEQGGNQQRITNSKKILEELNKKVSRQKMHEERQKTAQRRISATQDAIDRLSEVKVRQENQFRLQLERRVQEIFQRISFTPYVPKISDKYELTLIEDTTGSDVIVAASTGENQILSLSFISSIIDRVREWSAKKMLMVTDSSTFPIVMDSPFGSLDEVYRRQIARTIPGLANQLIILLTKTQWRGEVEEEISQKIGKEYVLTYYSSKPDCTEDYIELGESTIPLVKQSPNEFEYTEIIEVLRQ